jgi:peptide deformylase
MILKVARIGHPVVRAVARELTRKELRSAEIQRLIDDMVETMYEYEGVGLAAPQVHVPLRLAVLEVPASDERSHAEVPLTVLVNPKVTPVGDEKVPGFEGCLSIAGLRGLVPRWRRVALEALDRDARPYRVEAQDFHARVIQHECDHLDGSVYLDRMDGMRSLCFNEEWERHHAQAAAGADERGGDGDERGE